MKTFPRPPNSVIIHILHDNSLTAENRDKFIYIAGMYGQTVNFYNVEKLCANRIAEFRKIIDSAEKTRFSAATMYRFFIIDLLAQTTNKIIYLDSDTIINLDIKELWQVEIGDAPLAAVPEIDIQPQHMHISEHYVMKNNFVDYRNYFNSGVMILNLQSLKNERETIRNGIKFVSEHPCEWFDQDIFNYCFSEKYVKLPEKFDVFVIIERYNGRSNRIRPAIYHYIGASLGVDNNDSINRLWLKYFSKTPWFNESTLGNLYEGVRQIYIEQKNFAAQISALISGKTRAFFVAPNQIEAVRQIFYIQPNEEIIAAESPESLQRVANSLAARDKVFFVLTNEYPIVQQNLSRAGFVEGADFLNGLLFLSDAHGVPLNSYSLIKLL